MDRTLVITGSYPPEVCGVGDYTRNVMEAPSARGWALYHRQQWSLASLRQIICEIDARNPSEIFMQYPTQGFGWSLVPHLLCLYYSLFTRVRFTVVLHEFSQLSRKANLAARLLLLSADQIIFTNEFERQAAAKLWAPVRSRSRTVKIVSNIPVSDAAEGGREGRPLDLVYFGHVRPKKGLEAFLDAVRELRAVRPDSRIALIGQCPSGFESYTGPLLERCSALGMELMLEMPSDQVARALAQTKLVYLPFPDGISERRGTALAAMANGAVLLTTVGDHTTPELAEAVPVVSVGAAPTAVAARLQELMALQDDERSALCDRARTYLRRHLPQSWDDVARAYVQRA